jgi:hypothetical protein
MLCQNNPRLLCSKNRQSGDGLPPDGLKNLKPVRCTQSYPQKMWREKSAVTGSRTHRLRQAAGEELPQAVKRGRIACISLRSGLFRFGLGHERTGLHAIERVLPLGRQCLHLLRCRSRRQRAIGGIELLPKLIGLIPQAPQLLFRAFIVPQRGDGLNDFAFVDSSREIDMHDDLAVFQPRAGLLIEHRHDAGSIRPDLIAREIEVFDLSHAFEIGGDLLECLPLGVLDGNPGGVYPGIMLTHRMFAGRGDDPKDGLEGCLVGRWRSRGRSKAQRVAEIQTHGLITIFFRDPIPLGRESPRAGVIGVTVDLAARTCRSGQAEQAKDHDLRRRDHKSAPLSRPVVE